MRIYCERMLFAVWLLSQSFGFALTAVSIVPIQELPSCPAWGQNQTIDNTSKASSSLCLVDVETAALAVGDWSILAARVGSIFPYDLAPDFGFAGLYHLSRHNVLLAKHRVYDPDLGRWLSRDPAGEGAGLNLYSYPSSTV